MTSTPVRRYSAAPASAAPVSASRRARLRATIRAALGRRRPTAAELGYAATLEVCEAACTQIATAPDPWVRHLALLQLQAAHEAAALLAREIPPGDRATADLGPVGRGDAGMWQVHRVTAQLCAHLAATERRLHHPDTPPPSPRAGGSVLVEWARPLSELALTPDPRERARLVLTLGLLVDDGGRVTDHMHRIAAAYLHLAGIAPDAIPDSITAVYDQIAGAGFGLAPAAVAACGGGSR